jgi:hypothetical protein
MTATDERTGTADAGVPRCSAMVPVELVLGPSPLLVPSGLVACGLAADGWWQGSCPCGHVRDGWLCAFHGEQASDGGCRACLEDADNPHDCPLPVSRLTPGGTP